MATQSPQPSEPFIAPQGAHIDLDGHPTDVLMRLEHPRVALLGGLLTPAECQALIDCARPRLARSRTVVASTGGEEINADRTSRGMFFERGETALISRIEQRIARLLHWPASHGEGLQVLHYRPGEQYHPHYDYFDPAQPGAATLLSRGGQRVATLILYLNQPALGGYTDLPQAGLHIAAHPGNALFFAYPQAHPDSATLHAGAPVLEGEKWIATKWLRERVF